MHNALNSFILFFVSLFNPHNALNFQHYCNSIPKLSFPVVVDCDLSRYVYADSTVSQKLQGIYKPGNKKNVRIVGKLLSPDGLVYIIYQENADVTRHWMYTYDSEGRVIHTLNLQKAPCSEQEDVTQTSWAKISMEGKILMRDTLKRRDINKSVPGVIIANEYHYKLSKNGMPVFVTAYSDTLAQE